nr:hypothetical protein [Tanacetum cinerariifolium]
TIGGKSLAAMRLGTGSTFPIPISQDTSGDVSDPDPLSVANPHSIPTENVAQSSKGAAVAGDPESENTSFTSMAGSPESIYQPEWGVTNGCRLDTPKACQDLKPVAPEVPPPENVTTTRLAPEAGLAEEIAAMGPHVNKEHRKRGNDGVDTNAPPKVLKRDHADFRLTQSTIGGKSLAAMRLGTGSTFPIPISQDTDTASL